MTTNLDLEVRLLAEDLRRAGAEALAEPLEVALCGSTSGEILCDLGGALLRVSRRGSGASADARAKAKALRRAVDALLREAGHSPPLL